MVKNLEPNVPDKETVMNAFRALSKQVGTYDTCGNLCRYCYANTDPNRVKENRKKHDPASPFLIGESEENDVIHEAEQSSWKERRIRLF